MDRDVQRQISMAKMRLKDKHPYFTVLLGHLRLVQVDQDGGDSWLPTMATDGRTLFINGKFCRGLTPEHREFVLMHETLHAAMGHSHRRGARLPVRWNVACDHVVNLILKRAQLNILENTLCDEQYAGMTAEEVYRLLPNQPEDLFKLAVADILSPGEKKPAEWTDASPAEIESYWSAAKRAAEVAARMVGKESSLDDLTIQVERSDRDWRQVLWEELPFSQFDFTSWDRRLLHDGIYAEDLEPEKGGLDAAIFVDTSGSMVSDLPKIIGEVEQICALYPQLNVHAYFADAAVYGPVPLSELNRPKGGGGTSFVPAFDVVRERKYTRVIYVTDLQGEFPDDDAGADVIWITCPGVQTKPPFGKVVKIL